MYFVGSCIRPNTQISNERVSNQSKVTGRVIRAIFEGALIAVDGASQDRRADRSENGTVLLTAAEALTRFPPAEPQFQSQR